MPNFFNAESSNQLVITALKVSKVEQAIIKHIDSEALVRLYNCVQDKTGEIEKCMEEIQSKIEEQMEEIQSKGEASEQQ